jgi:cell division protein FtsW (lipid II flippase)
VGDGISYVVESITDFTSSAIGIELGDFQAKLISIMLLAFFVYLCIAVINFGTQLIKKILKWGLIVIFILFILSVLVSIFA